MNKLAFATIMVSIFLSGVVFCVNLSQLVSTNPEYEASWVNVWISLVFSTVSSIAAWGLSKRA